MTKSNDNKSKMRKIKDHINKILQVKLPQIFFLYSHDF